MIRRVLVVDDDWGLSTVLAAALGDEGFVVTVADNGLLGLRRFEADGADLIILDVLMPEMDGLEVLPPHPAQEQGADCSAVVARRRGRPRHRAGDGRGRLRRPSRSRRASWSRASGPSSAVWAVPSRRFRRRAAAAGGLGSEIIEAGPLRLDPGRFEVRWRGKPVVLTRSEFQILGALARNRGMVLARERLLDLARGDDAVVTDRTVDTFVKRLRKKIRDVDDGFDGIETVFGVGYRYRE